MAEALLNAPPDIPVPTSLDLDPQPPVPIGARLQLVTSGGECGIFLGGTAIGRFRAGDKASEDAALALLASADAASHVALAAVFGRSRNTVARVRQRLETGGMAAILPAKRGPKGPHKVTPELLVVIAANAGQPLGDVRQAVGQAGFALSRTHVYRLRQAARRAQAATQPALAVVPAAEPATDAGTAEAPPVEVVAPGLAVPRATPPPEPVAPPVQTADGPDDGAPPVAWDPPAMVPTQARGRYMGATLYYPALQVLGLVDAARGCFRLPRSERFGVRAVTLTLFFLTIFSRSTVEAAKHLRRWEFGPVVGSGRAPAVKTLRRKLAELVTQSQAAAFATRLARRWIEQGVVATAYLYIDGHMQAYHGKRTVAKVWNAQRQMPLPGVLTYFVNDLKGRPLLFLTEEANATLAQAMPRLVRAIREAVGDRRFTVVFDRGGYDGQLFAWLRQEHMDLLTYQRGNVALPRDRFQRREVRFEGRRVRFWIAEDRVRVGRSGPWRRIVVRTPTGHQTPILTSLDDIPAAKIACLMFARWRQENFFKYSGEHHGLDQLLDYAWAEADGTQRVPNPERKALQRALQVKRRELQVLRAELGQAVLDEPRAGGRTAHGLKVAQGGRVGQLRALEAELASLVDQQAACPEHIPLAQVGPRQVLPVEQKQIIDRIKITAYNAEAWLLERLLRHYPNAHDARDLLRAFAELPGEIRRTAHGVSVTLDPPDTPLHGRALRGLCADLSQLQAPYPGTALPVTYRVAVHHAEAAA